MPRYNTGTIAVTDNVIIGTNTDWAAKILEPEDTVWAFLPDGMIQPLPVTAVDYLNQRATIAFNWAGPEITDASYLIFQDNLPVRLQELIEKQNLLAQQYEASGYIAGEGTVGTVSLDTFNQILAAEANASRAEGAADASGVVAFYKDRDQRDSGTALYASFAALPDGAVYEIAEDSTRGGVRARFQKIAGVEDHLVDLPNSAQVAAVEDKVDKIISEKFGTIAQLKAATSTPEVGSYIKVETGPFEYRVAASSATDHDVTRDDGTKLYVEPDKSSVSDVQWFDIANDADRINAAIRFAIDYVNANGVLLKVKVSGAYTLDKPLECFDFTGSDFNFVTVALEAPAPGYIGGKRTEFKFTDGNAPGVVAHKARAVTLDNIALIGSANDFAIPSLQDLLDRNAWWNTNGARDQRYSPHAGIVIDPFDPTLGAGDKYPVYDGSGAKADHYVGSGGTTKVTLRNCEVQCWIVARMDSGSNVQLGDSIVFHDCNLSHNRVVWSQGESQNRGNRMLNCHGKYFDTLVDTVDYGPGTGSPNYLDGGVWVFGYHLVHANCSRGTGVMRGVYAESLWAIGHVNGGFGYTIEPDFIKLLDGATVGTKEPDYHLTGGGPVNFIGGIVAKYINVPRRIRVQNPINVFGTAMDDQPSLQNGTLHNLSHVILRYADGPIKASHVGNGALTVAKPIAGAGVWQNGTVRWTADSDYDFISHGTGTVTLGAGGTATVTGLDTDTLSVGDEIGTVSAITGEDNAGGSTTVIIVSIGVVTGISGGTVTLSGVIKSLANGSYNLRTYRFRKMHQVCAADTTSGSATLTNVTPTGRWKVGDWIRGAGIPAGSIVTGVSGSALAISKAATATASDIEIYDAKVRLEYGASQSAPASGQYPVGSFWTKSNPSKDGNNMILRGWLNVSGVSPGTWEPQYVSAATPAT